MLMASLWHKNAFISESPCPFIVSEILFVFILCVGAFLPAFVFSCACSAHEGQKRASDLELELQTVVSHYVDAGN